MPPNWGWVKDAKYAGKHRIDGEPFELWRYGAGGVELEVAVAEHNANRPHYFARRSATEHRTYHLITFSTFAPNATWFNVPDLCKNATSEAPAPPTSGSCAAIVELVRNQDQASNLDAVSKVMASFRSIGVEMPETVEEFRNGEACTGGAQPGDLFFYETGVAVYLGGEEFAECDQTRGVCVVVPPRDYSGGCRRWC